MTDRPMWCDDFDMDLPKVVPGAREAVGAAGEIVLFTHGHTTHDALNSPTCWNHDDGLVAFAGFASPRKPAPYWTRDPIVRCTGWEMFRDLWCHGCMLLVEGERVWNSQRLWPDFEAIMWNVRGWGDVSSLAAHRRRRMAELRALISIRRAARRLVDLHRQFGGTQ
ncbi:hypothetical protein [Shinella pollutisoli]|uniref:Uncharacterized protein n=1 Tax=Shinella pollutisoli TaxID=2250594 RepID=A0ABV7DKD8_9HYPH|nr:hypothetical protein [Shinella pollutisoli]